MAKEVSDRAVITLLVVAVVVSIVGSYFVLESINGDDSSSNSQSNAITESSATGFVTLNVVDGEVKYSNEAS